jgi:hypothetical protein
MVERNECGDAQRQSMRCFVRVGCDEVVVADIEVLREPEEQDAGQRGGGCGYAIRRCVQQMIDSPDRAGKNRAVAQRNRHQRHAEQSKPERVDVG